METLESDLRIQEKRWLPGFLSVNGQDKIHLLQLLPEISIYIQVVSGLHSQTIIIISVKLFKATQGIAVNSSPHARKC